MPTELASRSSVKTAMAVPTTAGNAAEMGIVKVPMARIIKRVRQTASRLPIARTVPAVRGRPATTAPTIAGCVAAMEHASRSSAKTASTARQIAGTAAATEVAKVPTGRIKRLARPTANPPPQFARTVPAMRGRPVTAAPTIAGCVAATGVATMMKRARRVLRIAWKTVSHYAETGTALTAKRARRVRPIVGPVRAYRNVPRSSAVPTDAKGVVASVTRARCALRASACLMMISNLAVVVLDVA